jgi:hypothetical protein
MGKASRMIPILKLKTARAVLPNAGLRARYSARMVALIAEMHNSVIYWLTAAYRDAPPRVATLAQDATPAQEMQDSFQELVKRWMKRFEDAAPTVAETYLVNAFRGSDTAMRMALKDAGWTVKFTMTPAMRDAFDASLAENVGLIKSIPAEYLQQVEGIVMRSYTVGRDLQTMVKELKALYPKAQNRAVLIARDQSNKSSAIVARTRQLELGLKEAIWLHSHAGKVPRPTHVAMNGKRYLIADGMWDSAIGKWIQPGEEINCFPEDSEVQFADFVSKAYRRFYRGDLAEIVTESGKMIRATPNHPILTPDGWSAIGRLNEGDNVFCVPDDRFRTKGFAPSRATVGEKNKDGAVPTFSEIFSSLSQAGNIRHPEVSHAAQFHGDGRPDGDVDVVFSARPLRFGRKPRAGKQFKQFAFSMSHDTATVLSALIQFIYAAFSSSYRVVCSLGESFPTLNAFTFHTDAVSLTATTNLSSSKDDAMHDGTPGDAVFSREREHACALLMFAPETERIIRVNRVHYEGYVCNLETRHGFYLTGNIIAHNCRCASRPILPYMTA